MEYTKIKPFIPIIHKGTKTASSPPISSKKLFSEDEYGSIFDM
jgi:hypothetical protein